MIKDKLYAYRHCIVYYDVCNDLNVDFLEYTILNTMVRKSKHNTYSKGVAYLSKYLCLSRTTVYKYLKRLFDKEHITDVSGKDYCLHHDLVDRFKSLHHQWKYLKVYHELKSKYDLNTMDCSVLYIIYSFSLNKKFRSGFNPVYCKAYLAYLPISERAFHKIKAKLIERGLLISHHMSWKVCSQVELYFVQKDHIIKECS